MPTIGQSFPYVTPWRNYRYKLTRLTALADYIVATATGGFETQVLDIWVDDDWLYHSDAGSVEYKLVMHHAANDECKAIYRPRVFIDGASGQSTSGQSVISSGENWFTIATANGFSNLNVSGANTLETKGTDGTGQQLYAIIPGVYIAFNGDSRTVYTLDDEFSWTFKNNALEGIPKIIDGSYRSWMKLPAEAGDSTYSENLPGAIINKSFTMLCYIAGMPKVTATTGNTGVTIQLQGSIDDTNWVDIFELVDDHDYFDTTVVDGITGSGPIFASVYDSIANDAQNYPYKRLKLEFEDKDGAEKTLHQHQFMDVILTPN